MRAPAPGSSQTTQGWASRSSVTASMAKWNAAPTPPQTNPMIQANRSHFTNAAGSCMEPRSFSFQFSNGIPSLHSSMRSTTMEL